MTNIENSMELRKSGLRIASVGIISVILAFIIYSRLTIPGEHLVMLTPELKTLASGVLAITFASMALTTYGISKIFKAEQRSMNSNSLLYYTTNAFSNNKYWKIMVLAAIAYGIFFGFLSQIFIYRNDISFSQQGIVIPSINIIPCCNTPGYVPMFSAYLTDHFLILLIPLNVILAVIVSALVGFNVSLGLYAFNLSRKIQSTKKLSFIGSVGAASGLFVGLPNMCW